ncbi:MAG: gamma-glutamylcyclotransferase family protein, partial [Polyangiales bacterium]
VHGELYEIDEVETVLHELDAYEDFSGYGTTDSLYRRSLVSAVAGHESVLAWTYVFLGDPAAFPLISSGRWTLA